MENTMTEKTTFTLPNRKVQVVPIRRKGGWLPDNHEAAFLFKHAMNGYVVPKDGRTGALVDPLTDEEREFFETKAGLALKREDLSVYKKDNNYWTNFRVKMTKDVMLLDLSKPMDYLNYKVLLANEESIAPSAQEKFNKATYKYAIVEEGYQNEEKVASASSKKTAYKHFGKIDSSPSKMRDFLNVYNSTRPGNITVPKNAKTDFLIAEIEKIIETNIKDYLQLAEDKHYDTKLIIQKGLSCRAIERDGLDYKVGGQHIGRNINEAVAFFENVNNNEEILKVKARIEAAE
jgi:hypothetical protein